MRKMFKHAVLLSAIGALALFGFAATATATGEIIVCHATGSQTNTFNIIVTDLQGASGHLKHEADIIAFNPTPQQLEEAKFLTQPESAPADVTAFCLSLVETTTTTSETPTTTTTTTTLAGGQPAQLTG